jgi:hypothetical protein
MAKKARKGPSSSQRIRDYAAEHGDAGPTAISRALTEQGVKVSPQYVSAILSTARRKAGKKGRRKGGRRRAANGQSAALPTDRLIAAKRFVDQMGSVGKAKEAVDLLARLLD